ncbi:tetraspanin-3-like isoform X2 [Antedon mediterranea]|uniref:tetraspanin-3-like isoform X2 n=1 Tax=Antedon mediterranea TaxID=105859 RepID=UPI003AF5BF45
MAGCIESLCLQCWAMLLSVVYVFNWTVMFVSLLLLTASFILLTIGKSELIDRFSKETVESMSHYGNNKMLTDTWDSRQSSLLCCGYYGKDDWIDNNQTIPNTCCRDIFIGCVPSAIPNSADIHTQGCKEDFIMNIKDFVNGLFVVVLVYSSIMIMFMLATLCTLSGSAGEVQDNKAIPI